MMLHAFELWVGFSPYSTHSIQSCSPLWIELHNIESNYTLVSTTHWIQLHIQSNYTFNPTTLNRTTHSHCLTNTHTHRLGFASSTRRNIKFILFHCYSELWSSVWTRSNASSSLCEFITLMFIKKWTNQQSKRNQNEM